MKLEDEIQRKFGAAIAGTHAYTPADIRELDQLVADRRIRPQSLITHRFSLSRTNDALLTMGRRQDQPLWVTIEPEG